MFLFITFEWVRSNIFYGLSLVFLYFTYAYLLKEIIWQKEWPHLFYFFCVCSIIGVSFNYFLEPNYIKAIYNIFTNRFSTTEIPDLVITSFSWIGWAILFSQIEQFAIDKLSRKEQPTSIQDYIVYFFIYMLFLNLFTIVLNEAFGRPF